jgi:hypothetical protein
VPRAMRWLECPRPCQPQARVIAPTCARPLAAARRARGVCAERVSFHEQHGTLGEDADLVAHRAPAGGRILQVDAVRFQHDQIDPDLPGIAHNLRGAVAEDDLLPSGHLACFKIVAEPREVVAGRLFEAVVERR